MAGSVSNARLYPWRFRSSSNCSSSSSLSLSLSISLFGYLDDVGNCSVYFPQFTKVALYNEPVYTKLTAYTFGTSDQPA